MIRRKGSSNSGLLPCRMGQLMCFVDSDGKVYPCGQLIGSFPALNFLETGFRAAWENLARNKNCLTCYCPCFIEFNQVFNLRPNALLHNALRELKTLIRM